MDFGVCKEYWNYRNHSITHLTVTGELFFSSVDEVKSNLSKNLWRTFYEQRTKQTEQEWQGNEAEGGLFQPLLQNPSHPHTMYSLTIHKLPQEKSMFSKSPAALTEVQLL